MDISAISSQLSSASLKEIGGLGDGSDAGTDPKKLEKCSKQFEAILLRQMLNDSLGKIAGTGTAGNVYGYMLTDTLADKISDAGGLGLAHVLQTQLSQHHK
jgi:flagellar protein FlgJ